MLTLPIEKRWYDLILSEVKTEEYREIKDYYTSRFINALSKKHLKGSDITKDLKKAFIDECRTNWYADEPFKVMFRNGYSKNSPFIIAECTLSVGHGNPEWGAVREREYYILHIQSLETGEPGFLDM